MYVILAVLQKSRVNSLSQGTEEERAQLFLGVCTITDEVCMHAKYSKLLSLATKMDLS